MVHPKRTQYWRGLTGKKGQRPRVRFFFAGNALLRFQLGTVCLRRNFRQDSNDSAMEPLREQEEATWGRTSHFTVG